MAWPPTPQARGQKYQNTSTTVEWGTDGILASYVVESIRSRDINEVIYIENGTGIRSIRIQLFQGREWDLTIIADQSFAHPAPGTQFTLVDPMSATGGGYTVTGTVIANEYDAARKREGRRTISVVFDTNIEGAGNVPNIGAATGNVAFPYLP